MAHLHSVYDTDLHFKIDAITRVITNQATLKTKLIQYDHNSERFTFEIPRYVDGHDMMLCNETRVHFINAGSARQQHKDVYPVYDVQLSPADSKVVIFSWLVSQNATRYAGTLNFLVQFSCVQDDGTIDYTWHTDIYKGIVVSTGMSNGDAIASEVSDVISQWEQELFGVGDTEEQRLIDAGTEQIAAIAAKAELVLDSIPEDYTETHNMADESLRSKADAIVQTAQGEHITASDCSDDYLRGLRIFGKTNQITTTGKNLFTVTETVDTSGITWDSENQKICIAPGTYGKVVNLHYFETPIPSGTTVTLSMHLDSGYIAANGSLSLGGYHTTESGSNNTWQGYVTLPTLTNLSGKTYTNTFVTTETVTSFVLFLNAGTTVNSNLVFAAQYEISESATSYEPYSNGIASPSPEQSQDLKSITSPTVALYGKNLLNPVGATQTNKDVVFTNNGDGSFTIKGTSSGAVGFALTNLINYPIKLYKGVTYTQSVDILSGTKPSMAVIVPSVKDSIGTISYNYFTDNQTKTPTSDYTIYSYTLYMDAGVTVDFTFRVQLEVGKTATEWEKYVEAQTLSASDATVLHGIPVTSGGNYTDSNGQQWICDEIDLERGVYIQRVQKVTINENTTYHYNTDNDFIQTNENLAPNVVTWETRILSTHFVPVGSGVTIYDFGWLQVDSGNDVRFRIDGIASVDELKTWMMANGPVEFVYPLVTPIETALSDVEIAAYKKLHSNYPNITIFNDSNVTMEVSYNADTKIYLSKEAERIVANILEGVVNGSY